MKDTVFNRLKAASILLLLSKFCQKTTTGWRILFLKSLHDLAEKPSENAVAKNCSKYHSNNPSHPLSAAIESPSWPPCKRHAQNKQNGRNYFWFWLFPHTKRRAKSRLQNLNSQGKDRFSLTTAESLSVDSLGRWNTNPSLGQMVAGSLVLSTGYDACSTED